MAKITTALGKTNKGYTTIECIDLGLETFQIDVVEYKGTINSYLKSINMKKVNPETGTPGVYSRSTFKVPEDATAKDVKELMTAIGNGFLTATKEIAKYRKDNPKQNSEVTTKKVDVSDFGSLTSEQKDLLLAQLLAEKAPKKVTPKKKTAPKKPTPKKDDDLDLDFTNSKVKF